MKAGLLLQRYFGTTSSMDQFTGRKPVKADWKSYKTSIHQAKLRFHPQIYSQCLSVWHIIDIEVYWVCIVCLCNLFIPHASCYTYAFCSPSLCHSKILMSLEKLLMKIFKFRLTNWITAMQAYGYVDPFASTRYTDRQFIIITSMSATQYHV